MTSTTGLASHGDGVDRLSTVRLDRRTLLKAGALSGALAYPGLLSACSDEPTEPDPAGASGEPVQGGTLVIGRTPAIELLDPTMQPLLGFPGGSFTRAVYEVLLPIEHAGGATPALATGFEVAADGLSITCELRDGVTWHSGRELTAEDIVWNLERVHAPDFEGWSGITGQLAAVAGIRAADDHTLHLTLSRPDLNVLRALQSEVKLIDPEFADATKAGEEASGTGPYMLEEFVPGSSMRLVRNPNYWGEGLPYLDEIELRTVADEQTLAVQLEAGDVQVAEPLPQREAARLQAAGFQVVLQDPANAFIILVANVREQPLADRRVRQALMYAIDRERVNEQALAGFGTPKAVIWAAGAQAFHEDQANAYPFDLDRARALLDAADVSSLDLSLNVRNDLPAFEEAAEIVRNDFASIGVTLDIHVDDPPVWTEAYTSGQYQLLIGASGTTFLDGAVVWSPPWLRPNPEENVTGFANERYTELAEATRVLGIDEDERQDLLREMTEIMLEEAFVLPIADRPITTVTAAEVQGLAYSPVVEGPELRLREAWLGA